MLLSKVAFYIYRRKKTRPLKIDLNFKLYTNWGRFWRTFSSMVNVNHVHWTTDFCFL